MESSAIRRVAAGAIFATALLHVYVGLIELDEYFGSVRYIGVMFLIGAAAGFIIAAQLWKGNDASAWIIGALVAGGMAAGFVLSRVTGLPDFDERGKWELEGMISLALEGAYLVAFAAWALKARVRPRIQPSATA
jgi:hypothetical protein